MRSSPTEAEMQKPRLLVVDDDPDVAKAIARAVREVARDVVVVHDPLEALARLRSESFDTVISDVSMPGMTGTELLRAVRARDLDLPVVLLTGTPSIETAAAAVELGAFRYLTKPFETHKLCQVVELAARTRLLAQVARGAGATERSALEASLRRAMASLTMAYQPIIAAETRALVGYEALMRPREPALPDPLTMLDAAEKLSALHVLGRRTRSLIANDLADGRPPGWMFVNLHPADLADPELYELDAPLSAFADKVVLELTERASLEGVGDLERRLTDLRAIGYRVAVDDLGAGYAGLSYFASVKPEIVKIDMSLVRNIDASLVKQRVVVSIVGLAHGLGMEIIAEGIETAAERDTVIQLGVTYLQGYLLARPAPPFPSFDWK